MTQLSYIYMYHIRAFLRCGRMCLKHSECKSIVHFYKHIGNSNQAVCKTIFLYSYLDPLWWTLGSHILIKKIFDHFLKLRCYSSNLSFWFPGYFPNLKCPEYSWHCFQNSNPSLVFSKHFQIMVTLQFNFSYKVFGS